MANRAAFIIRPEWDRPDASTLAAFAGIPTALIADALGHGFGVLDPSIRPLWDGPAFVGPALTVETAPDDILAVHLSLRHARPGDVIVIATRRSARAAVLGDVTATLLVKAGIVGAVTDGVARDVDGIEARALPAYARGITPGIPFKNGPGRIGMPVAVGDVAICPGDIVAADRDGVIVVPLAHASHVIAALERARAVESALVADVEGADVPTYAQDALAAADVTIVD